LSILQVEDLSKRFGGIAALFECSFSIQEPGIYGLIGPNGAGKTTFFDVCTGHQDANAGSILFMGQPLLQLKPFQIANLGVSRTFQECRVFPEKTCLENLLFSAQKKGMVSNLIQVITRSDAARKAITDEAMRLLSMVNLEAYANEPASVLSYGQKRLLETVSAFITKPRMLLLDEPASGVNPTLINTLKEFIEKMFSEINVVFLIIEHNMEFIMSISSHIIVMHQGEIFEEGTPDQIHTSKKVIDAYLG